jgi:hypothetical protein
MPNSQCRFFFDYFGQETKIASNDVGLIVLKKLPLAAAQPVPNGVYGKTIAAAKSAEVQQAETKPVLTFFNPDHHRAEFTKTSTFMIHLVRVLMDASFHLLTSQNPAFSSLSMIIWEETWSESINISPSFLLLGPSCGVNVFHYRSKSS